MKSKKNIPSHKEKIKTTPKKKPPKIRTAEGWKNYLKQQYFSKK